MEIILSNLEGIGQAAKDFIKQIGNHRVFAFEGQMGVGKTTFISALLREIGIDHLEGSPTYSIVNEYHSMSLGKIYHFDVYRLKSELEAYEVGFDEILEGEGICFIEWPDKIENLLPHDTIWVYIRKLEDESRTITFDV